MASILSGATGTLLAVAFTACVWEHDAPLELLFPEGFDESEVVTVELEVYEALDCAVFGTSGEPLGLRSLGQLDRRVHRQTFSPDSGGKPVGSFDRDTTYTFLAVARGEDCQPLYTGCSTVRFGSAARVSVTMEAQQVAGMPSEWCLEALCDDGACRDHAICEPDKSGTCAEGDECRCSDDGPCRCAWEPSCDPSAPASCPRWHRCLCLGEGECFCEVDDSCDGGGECWPGTTCTCDRPGGCFCGPSLLPPSA